MSRSRGQEWTAQIQVDSEILAGSFTKIESFDWNPEAEIPASDFIGQESTEYDLRFDGYRFTFEIHQIDNKAVEVWLDFVKRLRAGATLPNITLSCVRKFRDLANPAKTLSFERCVLKLDKETSGGRKGYAKTSWSGASPSMRSF